MIIYQDQTNDLIFNFQENVTITGSTYLLLLLNDFTEYASYTIVQDISENKDRYNEFIVVETTNPQPLNGQMALRPSGFYHYEIYEQTSQTNLLPVFAGQMVDTGRIKVIGTGDTNYISNLPLVSLTEEQVEMLLAALNCENVGLISSDQIGCLTSSQVQQLTYPQIHALTNSQIGYLTSGQTQSLTNTQISYLSPTQIQVLVNTQLGNLTNSQLQYLLSTVISNQFYNNNLSQAQKNGINTLYSLPTGQITSFATGDDGNLQHGRLIDFFTLKFNNPFGNTKRFTDESGNQNYTSHYLIDHATGLGWYLVLQTAANWATAINPSISLTVGGNTYTDFKLPNVSEVFSITHWYQMCLNYAPFNLNPGGSAQLWTSTTNYSNTTNAFRVSYQTFPAASTVAKTASQPYLYCRIHY